VAELKYKALNSNLSTAKKKIIILSISGRRKSSRKTKVEMNVVCLNSSDCSTATGELEGARQAGATHAGSRSQLFSNSP
jgi:hypothetical protein